MSLNELLAFLTSASPQTLLKAVTLELMETAERRLWCTRYESRPATYAAILHFQVRIALPSMNSMTYCF